jgi:hypothetical protein
MAVTNHHEKAVMDLLPGLSAEQKLFAVAFFPVFEKLKTAILLLSGAALMEQSNPGYFDKAQDVKEKAKRELEKAMEEWQTFGATLTDIVCQTTYDRVFYSIRQVIKFIECDYVNKRQWEFYADKLSRLYREMRQLALEHWRLELIGCSGHEHNDTHLSHNAQQ